MPRVAKEKEKFFSAHKLLERTRAGRDPVWIANLREKAGRAFEPLDFPTTRDEEWKYTNVTPILKAPYVPVSNPDLKGFSIAPFTFEESRGTVLVFIDGQFSRGLSNLSDLANGIVVGNLGEISEDQSKLAKLVSEHLAVYADYRDDAFTALNTALIGDGAFVYIPSGKVAEIPIHLLFVATASERAPEAVATNPRILIVAGESAIATVIESYVSVSEGVYFTNAVTEVFAARDSVITHYRLQEESDNAYHIATTEVYQERGSNYSSYAISLGGEITRHTLNVILSDERIETTIDGLYVVAGRQHIDNHTSIDHQKPHCTSHQLYKGILDGKSRAVFNGKVFVREGALLTDAHQLNKNLMLSTDATVDTKPQLEIFADDVKCSHGAAIGQLEDEELFYLASRGIEPERARALLTYGFAEDVIRKIKLKSVHERLDKMVLNKLHQSIEVN